MYYTKNVNDERWYAGAVSQVRWQALSSMELSLDPEIDHSQNAVRFYDCNTDSGQPCFVESRTRNHPFGELDPLLDDPFGRHPQARHRPDRGGRAVEARVLHRLTNID